MKLETYKAKFIDSNMKNVCNTYAKKIEKYLETCNDLNEIRTQRESIIDAEIKLSEKIVNIPAITEEDKKTLVWNLQMYIEAVKELFDNAIFMLEN